MDRKAIVRSLEAIVGSKCVAIDSSMLMLYGGDRTREFTLDPLAIVFPETVEQVQGLVKLANSMKLTLVPSGGRTGLSGGACATRQEVVVSMERMNRILGFDALDRVLMCEAGVLTDKVHDFAARQQLFFPLDLAASGSSQIGGNVATNAGGNRVMRYGMLRHYVRGLTVVTGTGDILRLGHGLKKNNAGYDVLQLMIGSEGTLGIICEVELELVKMPEIQTALLGLEDFSQAMNLLLLCQNSLRLLSFEYISAAAMQQVMHARILASPFKKDYQHFVLIEHDGSLEEAQHALGNLIQLQQAGCDGIVAKNIQEARRLRAFREGVSEAIAPANPLKCDVAVKPSRLTAFHASLHALAHAWPDWQLVLFGHLGDGNLHVNWLPRQKPQEDQRTQLAKQVYELVARCEGTFSAEHGIGLTKKHLLAYYPESPYRDAMLNIKRSFDPAGVLNPGKIIDYRSDIT